MEIGGYFELELKKGTDYHSKALKLNTGRNAFEYILKVKGYKRHIYLTLLVLLCWNQSVNLD